MNKFFISPEGVVELWLTSEDTGAYGKDIGVRLPDLLWKIIEVIPKGCMMRIGMTNPPYIQEYLPVGCFCYISIIVFQRGDFSIIIPLHQPPPS